MSSEALVSLAVDRAIAWITLNRPEARNAFSRDMLHQLSSHLDQVREDNHVQAVILTGTGEQAFSAGADIRILNSSTPLEVREFARLAVQVTNKIEGLGKTVIAALNGHALGGGLEIAEACTLRIAVPHAQLGHPEVRIGALAGWGGTTRLSRLIGRGRAAELLLTGETISAEQACLWGLVNRVVPQKDLLDTAYAIASTILKQSPVAVRLTWEALHRGADLSLEESARLGADYFGLVAATEDFKVGTQAFLNKVEPEFSGR
ncbi:enoyl-CoA hydratase/isomerase family protein [Deinococcus planocerae]|uniref:enoyl-CoA hydratase/isomerase family protein n=1 Tax=Deinococcus planocerae TaxID=1737569 RepID=UPI000C7F3C59|nr:enoyl-CoA hydratase-related protein [Deinococcus planocerae]